MDINYLYTTIKVLEKEQDRRIGEMITLTQQIEQAENEHQRQTLNEHLQTVTADYSQAYQELEVLREQKATLEIAEPGRTPERLKVVADAIHDIVEAKKEDAYLPNRPEDPILPSQIQQNEQKIVEVPTQDPVALSLRDAYQQNNPDQLTNAMIALAAAAVLAKEKYDSVVERSQQKLAEQEARGTAERQIKEAEEQKRQALDAFEQEYGDLGVKLEASQYKRQEEFDKRHERLDTDPAILNGFQSRLDEQFKAEWDALEADRKRIENERDKDHDHSR